MLWTGALKQRVRFKENRNKIDQKKTIYISGKHNEDIGLGGFNTNVAY